MYPRIYPLPQLKVGTPIINSNFANVIGPCGRIAPFKIIIVNEQYIAELTQA